MRTIEVTLDEKLIAELDQIVKERSTNHSAFIQDALRKALANYRERSLIEKHQQGYLRYLVTPEEFSNWEGE